MTKNELLTKLDKWLRGSVNEIGKVDTEGYGGALKDIKKAQRADLGVFILGACFVDVMASFRYGVTKEMIEDERVNRIKALKKAYKNYKKPNERFQDFVVNYLPDIYHGDDGRDFYISLRCGLVHNYRDQLGKYAFISGRKELHRGMIGSTLVINREDFVDDLEKAYEKLRGKIENNDEVFNNAKARYESLGLMEAPEVDISPPTETDQ